MAGTRTKTTSLALALLIVLVGPDAGMAQNSATTEIALLYGDMSFGEGFRLGNNGFGETDRLTATLTHSSTWDYGDTFFFVDVWGDFDSDGVTDNEVDFFGEIYEQLSIGKIFGLDFGNSFIRDVGLNAGINAGDDIAIGLYGSRIDFNVPGFNTLTFAGYVYDNWKDPFERDLDTTYQFTISWNATLINQGRLNIWTQGFIDFIGDQGLVDDQWLWQPQLRMDVGQLIGGTPGRLEAGFEFSWWEDKFGVKGVRDRILQLILVYKFH